MVASVSEPTAQNAPPGWYPDHANPALQRWWDGTQWTEHVQHAYVAGGGVPAQELLAPAGTEWNTPWIWLVIALPFIPLIPLLFTDFAARTAVTFGNGTMAGGTLGEQLLSFALSTAVAALIIVFAWLDHRTLVRRGVPAPFHWAFAFFALIGVGVIYAIGRGLVTKRRTGNGGIVTTVAILSIVLGVILFIVYFSVGMAAVLADLDTLR